MNRYFSIRIKAAFLFVVFALNTVVGFACATGIDMEFNSKHHHEATEAVVHVHKDGQKHVHHEKKEGNSHDKFNHEENASNSKSENEKDNCCNKKVTEIGLLDKAVPPSISLTHPVFFTVFLSTYYQIDILPYKDIVRDLKPFVRGHHPPIQDIRIAIQSFLI